MSSNLKALLVTIVLYALLALLVLEKMPTRPLPKKEEKIALDIKQFVPPKPTVAQHVPPNPKPLPKPTAQKVPKKAPKKVSKEPIKKPPKKLLPKPKQQKPLIAQKKQEENTTRQTQKSPSKIAPNSPKMASLSELFQAPQKKLYHARENPKIAQLYGNEFQNYTKGQQEFIQNNLDKIGEITQNELNLIGYPELAGRMGQQGINVMEFYLHPNGRISNLRIIKSADSSQLDATSLQTVEQAYRHYPRPKEKTKIRIYVTYRIWGKSF